MVILLLGFCLNLVCRELLVLLFTYIWVYTLTQVREREKEEFKLVRAKWYTLVDISIVVVAVEHVDKDKLTTLIFLKI